ncbi:hypothetical protein NMY22_g374 [Coprinellus aureogranulatus]|nr:hypothetical protein NMY22_g374 [Coprinellus aureogranulatus]
MAGSPNKRLSHNQNLPTPLIPTQSSFPSIMSGSNIVPLQPSVAASVATLLSQLHATVNMLLSSAQGVPTDAPMAQPPSPLERVSEPVGTANVAPRVPIEAPLHPHVEELGSASGRPVKWYAILVGREPGVYRGSEGVAANLKGVPDNQHKVFGTEQEAVAFYDEALRDGKVIRVTIAAYLAGVCLRVRNFTPARRSWGHVLASFTWAVVVGHE